MFFDDGDDIQEYDHETSAHESEKCGSWVGHKNKSRESKKASIKKPMPLFLRVPSVQKNTEIGEQEISCLIRSIENPLKSPHRSPFDTMIDRYRSARFPYTESWRKAKMKKNRLSEHKAHEHTKENGDTCRIRKKSYIIHDFLGEKLSSLFYEEHNEKKLKIISSSKNNRSNTDSLYERDEYEIPDVSKYEEIKRLKLREFFRSKKFENQRCTQESYENLLIDADARNSDFELQKNREKNMKRQDDQNHLQYPMKKMELFWHFLKEWLLYFTRNSGIWLNSLTVFGVI